MTSRRWPRTPAMEKFLGRRVWIPLGGWEPSFPEPPPRPKFPPNQVIRTGRVPPPPTPPPNRIVKVGSVSHFLAPLILAGAIVALIWSGIIYAGAKAEPTCVALSSVGPGVGTVETKILWSGWACEGDDGLWRWSHPATWDPVTVSETPPIAIPEDLLQRRDAIDAAQLEDLADYLRLASDPTFERATLEPTFPEDPPVEAEP